MTGDERLALIRLKIEQAKRHESKMEAELASFWSSKPYEVWTKSEIATRRLIYFAARAEAVPVLLSLIVGDVIHNLRSALDHLAYQLVLLGMKGKTPGHHVYFPIADNAVSYKAIASKNLKGADLAARKIVDGIKPYKGANDTLWFIHRLDIVDKHRLLVAVVSSFRSFDAGGHMEREREKRWAEDSFWRDQVGKFPKVQYFIGPGQLSPLSPGEDLFGDQPGAEVDDKMGFRFDVAFNEPTILGCRSVRDTLQQMFLEVESGDSFKTESRLN